MGSLESWQMYPISSSAWPDSVYSGHPPYFQVLLMLTEQGEVGVV